MRIDDRELLHHVMEVAYDMNGIVPRLDRLRDGTGDITVVLNKKDPVHLLFLPRITVMPQRVFPSRLLPVRVSEMTLC